MVYECAMCMLHILCADIFKLKRRLCDQENLETRRTRTNEKESNGKWSKKDPQKEKRARKSEKSVRKQHKEDEIIYKQTASLY